MEEEASQSTGLKITEIVSVNSIYWISSLKECERGPTRRVIEDLETFSEAEQIDFQHFEVASAKAFEETMKEISHAANFGVFPLLHFDCHGHPEKGLLMSGSNEFVSWEEVADLLRDINVRTDNNLSCVFGVCFGLHLGFQLSLSKPTPFYLMIGPQDEIKVGFLEDNLVAFYRQVFQNGNITGAFAAILSSKLTLFHCQRLFARSMAQYFATQCAPDALKARAKQMASSIIGRTKRRQKQREFYQMLRPSQEQVDHFAQKFLIGREPGANLQQLRKMARGMRKQHVREI